MRHRPVTRRARPSVAARRDRARTTPSCAPGSGPSRAARPGARPCAARRSRGAAARPRRPVGPCRGSTGSSQPECRERRPIFQSFQQFVTSDTLTGPSICARVVSMTNAAITVPAIRVEGLEKRFGDVVALAGVDFDVPTGTVLGLLGPNGAGKTTAVRALTTIIRPDAGRAEVLGFDVVKRPEAVRARIGLAGQFAAVDENLTGRENLQLIGRLTHLPRAVFDARTDELLERFELTDAADRPVRTYSGGMRRRLDVSAALVHRPPVLFLDEPTTN